MIELTFIKISTLSALIQMCVIWFENMDNGKLIGVDILNLY